MLGVDAGGVGGPPADWRWRFHFPLENARQPGFRGYLVQRISRLSLGFRRERVEMGAAA